MKTLCKQNMLYYYIGLNTEKKYVDSHVQFQGKGFAYKYFK